MITRSIGGILRGNCTAVQLFLACVLGGMAGFIPGFSEAPGIIVFLALLLLVLNANLGIATLTALMAKIISVPLIPITFKAGELLLDGPTQGLFRTMINAPVLALFGFEYYLTTGGLLMGLIVGCIIGIALVKFISTFRARMAHMEENSDKFKNVNSKWYIRFLVWLLLGKGKGKKTTYNDLLDQGLGHPIRWSGVVVALLLVASLVGVRYFFTGSLVKGYLKSGLEQANGATVDVGDFKLDLGTGNLSITNLAMADPNALDTDLLRAAQLTAKVSTSDLLRKRFQVDTVVINDASQGEKRASPGVYVGKPPEPAPAPPKPGDKSLDDYLKEAKVWKERLAQVKKWLDKISSHKEGEKTPDQTAKKPETLAERLKREINESGYAHVQASHLVEGAPRFLLKDLKVLKMRVPYFGKDETVDLVAENLSTDPNLIPDVPSITINTSKKTLDLLISLAGSTSKGGINAVNLKYANLSADSFAKNLLGGGNVLKGGTIDFETNGTWAPAGVNLPLNVTLNNTAVAGQKLKVLPIKFSVTGPLDSPSLGGIDPDAIMKAVASAALGGVTDKLTGELDKKVGGEAGKIIGGGAGDLLGGLTGKKPTTKQK